MIDTLYMKRASSPLAVTSKLLYTQRDQKWQVVESRSRFTIGGKDYEETIEFFYNQIEGFWLPSRVRQQLKEGTRLMQSSILTLSRYQIN